MRILPIKLGLSMGIVWGLAALLSGWFAIFGWCVKFVSTLSSIYIGFAPTFWGGILGALWAFLNGFVIGYLIAAFYNIIKINR